MTVPMPWMETDVPMERLRFIDEHRKGCWSMTELCEAFGVSRKTGYKLLARFGQCGSDGLRDQSRAPKTHPNRIPGEVEHLVIQVRKQRRTWGSKKILAWLERHHPEASRPARSTVDEILKRSGLVQPRRRRRRCTPSAGPLIQADRPNAVWSADYKGWFRLGNGQRCDPLTILDSFSRRSLRCDALVSPRLADVQERFRRAFVDYGLPDAILSDNGPPFGSTGIAGLTALSVWLLRLGIRPLRIEPGRPEQNGRHERFHLTLEQETASPPKATPAAQQRAFGRFRRRYNEERPHEALAMRTPADVYEASPRRFPSTLPDWTYPSDYQVRQVGSNGHIKWRGHRVKIGRAIAGESVGLEEVSDGIWHVYLGELALGTFHEHSRHVIPSPSTGGPSEG